MSFGRKGLAPGQVAPAPGGGFGRAVSNPPGAAASDHEPDTDDLAARREAFIAAERARKAAEIAENPVADDPLADLRNSSRPMAMPARPLTPEPVGASGMTASQEAEIRAAARSMARNHAPAGGGYAGGGSSAGFVFGDPAGRSVGLAYVLWFVLGQLSIHRFYCGQKDSAIMQLGLFIGSLVTLFIFPPIGMIGFLFWVFWIVADLFLIPGMLRRFKAEHDYRGVFA